MNERLLSMGIDGLSNGSNVSECRTLRALLRLQYGCLSLDGLSPPPDSLSRKSAKRNSGADRLPIGRYCPRI